MSTKLEMISSKNRLVTLRYLGKLIHSLYDPVGEAERMILPLLYNWLQDRREACRKPDQSAPAPLIVKQGREVIQSLIDHTESSEKPCD
jgi:exonuclease III